MRIAFVGKGGSGKTTLAAAFIRYASKHRKILAIDADLNVNLKHALGISESVAEIGHLYSVIAEYVRGNRTDLGATPIVATTPPSLSSRFIRVDKDDPFLRQYATSKENISLLSVGTYQEADVGHSCYHGKLNTLEVIYHHLLDTELDLIVADATAGIDNLGTSLFFAYDLNVFVVEPTQKSIDVYKEFEKVSRQYNLRTVVIINKAENGDEDFVKKHIHPDVIFGIVNKSLDIKKFEQGDKEAMERFTEDNASLFEDLMTYASSLKKDWSRYYKLLIETHHKNSVEWWNDFYGQPIDKQKDDDFNYLKVL